MVQFGSTTGTTDMAKVALTDVFIRSIEPSAAARSEFADIRCAGLALRVTAAGAKTFSFRFRDPASGKVTRATLGAYPDVGLAAARAQADRMRRGVRQDGINPVAAKREARENALTRTFGALADQYLIRHARLKKRSAAADERNLGKHVLPFWRDRPVDGIKRADVSALVDRLVDAGSPIQANRIIALVSKVFNFGLNRGAVEFNPAARFEKPGRERPKERILTDVELAWFWHAVMRPPVSPAVGFALRFALLTATRASEAAEISEREIETDATGQSVWTIPAPRSKNGKAHVIPLSDLAVQQLQRARERGDGDREFVFRSPSRAGRPITGHALAVAMARLAKSEGCPSSIAESPPTPHDLRRSAATRLAALGIAGETISAALNHQKAGVTGRHYDQHDRLAEKRSAFAALADEIGRKIA